MKTFLTGKELRDAVTSVVTKRFPPTGEMERVPIGEMLEDWEYKIEYFSNGIEALPPNLTIEEARDSIQNLVNAFDREGVWLPEVEQILNFTLNHRLPG